MDTRTSSTKGGLRRPRLVAVLALSVALLALALAPIARAGFEDFAIESSSATLSSAQAGAHADFETRFKVTKDRSQSQGAEDTPWTSMRDVATELPPGLLGNPSAYPTCEAAIFPPEFSNLQFCPTDTQVGMVSPGISGFVAPGGYYTPLINLEPPAGDPHVVARLGFVAFFFPMYIDLRLDPRRENALTATVVNAPSVSAATGSYNTFWGVPGDESHDTERFNWAEALFCAGQCSGPVESQVGPVPFMSNPTSCGPAEVGTALRGYEIPQGFDYDYTSLPDIEGCDSVPFEATMSLAPTTNGAGASSGLDMNLSIPQPGMLNSEGLASAHLRKAVVTLPQGMSLNASTVDGLGSCSEEQIGLDRNERQIVDVNGFGAPVRLELEGQATAELPQIATAAQVQAALEALPNVAPGDVVVSGRRGGPWVVDFAGAFGGQPAPTVAGVHSDLQQLVVTASGGTYTLGFDGQTTASIPFDAEAAEVQAALEALPNVAPGDLVVSGGRTFGAYPDPGGFGPDAGFEHRSFHIAFGGALGGVDQPLVVGTNESLTGASPFWNAPAYADVITLTEGGSPILTHTVKQGGTVAFDEELPACPESSKVATGEIVTPLLKNPLKATVYMARQGDNPFSSLFAGYLVAQGEGVLLKVPAKFDVDPSTGQIVATFENNPQQPFTSLSLQFKGGNRGLVTTPAQCGTYRSSYVLTPWSGTAPVEGTSEFTIDQNCGGKGFAPGFRAGATSPLAGGFTTFAAQVTRDPGTPVLTGIDVNLPPGMTAKLAGIPYCPDSALGSEPTPAGTGAAEAAAPSCPAASEVGTVTVGSGSGSPFYVKTGKAYLAGPYKGAPVSLAMVVPALAGPFDLGKVTVRVPVSLDPKTAQVHAETDPLPTILHGVPLDLRDVRVLLDRQGFILNPTTCEPEAATGTITGAGGVTADVSSRFQVGECAALQFKPKISLRLKGGTTRAKHPALTVVLRPHPGDANISSLSVTFPKSELLDQSHINGVCTRVQFAADQCPAGSVYGKVTAWTPLLDKPLQGNVYLRASGRALPDLVTDLRGPAEQPIRLEASGRTDSVHGGLRNTFDFMPDAPITRVVLNLKGGKKGLLQNGRNLCAGESRAAVHFTAHNGRSYSTQPKLLARCGGKHGKGKGKGKSNR